jgi:hypothetical protein
MACIRHERASRENLNGIVMSSTDLTITLSAKPDQVAQLRDQIAELAAGPSRLRAICAVSTANDIAAWTSCHIRRPSSCCGAGMLLFGPGAVGPEEVVNPGLVSLGE